MDAMDEDTISQLDSTMQALASPSLSKSCIHCAPPVSVFPLMLCRTRLLSARSEKHKPLTTTQFTVNVRCTHGHRHRNRDYVDVGEKDITTLPRTWQNFADGGRPGKKVFLEYTGISSTSNNISVRFKINVRVKSL